MLGLLIFGILLREKIVYKSKEEGAVNIATIHNSYAIIAYGSFGESSGFCVYDLDLAKKIQNVELDCTITCIKVLKDNTMCIGLSDGGLSTWDIRKGDIIDDLMGHKHSVVSIDANDLAIVSGGADYCFKLWDGDLGTLAKTIDNLTDGISTVHILGSCVIMVHANVVTVFKFQFNMTDYLQRFKSRYIAIAKSFTSQNL